MYNFYKLKDCCDSFFWKAKIGKEGRKPSWPHLKCDSISHRWELQLGLLLQEVSANRPEWFGYWMHRHELRIIEMHLYCIGNFASSNFFQSIYLLSTSVRPGLDFGQASLDCFTSPGIKMCAEQPPPTPEGAVKIYGRKAPGSQGQTFVPVMSIYEKWTEFPCLSENGHGYFKRHI